MGFVLVFTLLATQQVGFYSGDDANNQTGKPTVFVSQALCETKRASQMDGMLLSRQINPNLPAFKLECLTLDKAPVTIKPGKGNA